MVREFTVEVLPEMKELGIISTKQWKRQERILTFLRNDVILVAMKIRIR